MSECKAGDKPKITYKFSGKKEKTYISKFSPIEVSVKEAPKQGTSNYSNEGFEFIFAPSQGGNITIVVKDYTIFKLQDPNIPTIFYDSVKFIYCGSTKYIDGDVGIGVDPNDFSINTNIRCPDTSPKKCTIEVRYNNMIIFSDQGDCPCEYSVQCGNCPECMKEKKIAAYPGYCCSPKPETISRLNAIVNKLSAR